MPIRVIHLKNGTKAYKYGPTGKTYTGKDSYEKARAQGQAIEISKHKKVRVKSSERAKGYVRQI